jgi:hypothetical protein
MFSPVLGDVDPAGHPDAVVSFDIVEEPPKSKESSRPAEEPAVHSDRHHLREFGPSSTKARVASGFRSSAIETAKMVNGKPRFFEFAENSPNTRSGTCLFL